MSLNNAVIYCEQKMAPPGSDWYYALRNISQKNLILALLALDQEWKEILTLRHEPSLAAAKFSWWQKELANAFIYAKPQHPITQLLMHEGFQGVSALEKLWKIYVDKIEPVFYALEAEWLSQSLLNHNIYRIIAMYSSMNEENLKFLSRAFFISDVVIHLRNYLMQGEIPFAQETLRKFSVNIEILQALQMTEELKKLLAYIKNFAEESLKHIVKDKNNLLFLRRYAKLRLTLLNEIAHENFPVFTHQISLTPIRKLFLTCFVK